MSEHTDSPNHSDPYGARMQVWKGRSGRRYVHSVYRADAVPHVADAIYLMIGRDAEGLRKPIAIEPHGRFLKQTPCAMQRNNGQDRIDEVHVHMVASARDAAMRAIEDLRAGLQLPSGTAGTP